MIKLQVQKMTTLRMLIYAVINNHVGTNINNLTVIIDSVMRLSQTLTNTNNGGDTKDINLSKVKAVLETMEQEGVLEFKIVNFVAMGFIKVSEEKPFEELDIDKIIDLVLKLIIEAGSNLYSPNTLTIKIQELGYEISNETLSEATNLAEKKELIKWEKSTNTYKLNYKD